MRKYNVIIVFNKDKTHILMCYRKKDPYKGLFNLVGGKVEDNESEYAAAYRELFEETGISDKDIKLNKLMDFIYHVSNEEVAVFVGTLNKNVELIEEKHPLHWIKSNENFFDMKKFAGEGNIGHMLAIVQVYEEKMEE